MAKGTFTVGGTDGMHMTPGKQPFSISGKNGGRSTVKFARTTGVGPNPGGDGNMISANAARGPVKGGINGPGTAK